jgi:alkanesulfonate monooxygenase SsuD/methylene tetrahydromethanopterin reductase-like flavin-dependent oxidoreductase (luciferase family)
MTILGAIFLPQNPPERLREVARVADEAGLEELWLWEDSFFNSGVAAAAAALAWTDNLRVGIGLLPVPYRNVALTAMEIATMCRLFGDRALVGIGHGMQDWMAQAGVRVDSPMTLLREHVTALQALLRGETVTTTGRYVNLDRVELAWPPDSPPDVYVGAISHKTLQLSGELAQGTILVGGTSPDGVRAARHDIGTANHDVVMFLPAATGPGAEERLADQQRRYGDVGPGVAGDAAEIADGVRRWADAGATTVVLQPTTDEPDLDGFIRFVAGEVRPLVD